MITRRKLFGVGLGALAIALVAMLAPAAPAADPGVPVKEFKVLARSWSFSPDRITVEEGTKVILNVESHDAPHSFVLKAFRVKVALPQDKTTTVEFVAGKPGTYRWYCGRPCGNGCPKMTGELTVLPRAEETGPGDAQAPAGS